MTSDRLYSDEAGALSVVEISPIGLYFELPTDDPGADIWELRTILTDGSLDEDIGILSSYTYDESGGVLCVYSTFTITAHKTLINSILDLSRYSGVRINGINYYKAES